MRCTTQLFEHFLHQLPTRRRTIFRLEANQCTAVAETMFSARRGEAANAILNAWRLSMPAQKITWSAGLSQHSVRYLESPLIVVAQHGRVMRMTIIAVQHDKGYT